MKLRAFKQNKLWRDKIVELVESNGAIVHKKQLSDAEFAQELKRKFMEEALEVAKAADKKELIEELGDIFEVITSLCAVYGFTMEDIICAQRKKNEKVGNFANRIFVTVAEYPVGSFGEKYCLADPEKYPEIIDAD